MPLLCHGCHNSRNKMAERVQVKATVPIKVSKKVIYPVGSLITVGFLCIKCVRKRLVATKTKVPKGMGWRTRFNLFLEELRKKRKKDDQSVQSMPQAVTTADNRSS